MTSDSYRKTLHRLVQIIVPLLLVSGVALLILPERLFASFYDVRYMGFAGLVYAALILGLPTLIRVKSSVPRANEKNRAADLTQLGLLITFIGNAAGDLGLYQLYRYGFEFDKLVHFLTPFIAAALLPIILRERFNIRWQAALMYSFSLIIICGIAWELFEFGADKILQTRIYGINGADINNDTRLDLVLDVIGSLCGILIAMIFHRKNENTDTATI